jgi:phenylacetate-CoA ligase
MNEWISGQIVNRMVQCSRGENIFKYYKEIQHVPFLSFDEIKAIQVEKLRRTLNNAYHNIPFYRRLYDDYGIVIDKLDLPGDIKALPVLSKDFVRTNYTDFITPNIQKRISKELTSGSSGNPLTVVKDRDKSAYVRAVMYRCYNQYGINIGHRQARFWGLPISLKFILKEKLKDVIANRIRLSAFDIHEKSLLDFTNKLKKFKPRYFYGYPSVLYKYASWLLEKGYDLRQ